MGLDEKAHHGVACADVFSMAHQEKEARMATGTQITYDVDVADVEYLRHGDKPLLARLFKPRGSGPFPLMVELHGGAWVRGIV